MPLVSVTRLRVRSWRYLPGFIWYAFRSQRQAKADPGNLGVALLADKNFVFWTRSVWRERAALRSFMTTGAHAKVMPHLSEWCDEAAVVHWNQDLPTAPSWLEAHRRLQQEGRRSRVSHPSPAQQLFEIPEPKVSSG